VANHQGGGHQGGMIHSQCGIGGCEVTLCAREIGTARSGNQDKNPGFSTAPVGRVYNCYTRPIESVTSFAQKMLLNRAEAVVNTLAWALRNLQHNMDAASQERERSSAGSLLDCPSCEKPSTPPSLSGQHNHSMLLHDE
jgi:hypothetical protein